MMFSNYFNSYSVNNISRYKQENEQKKQKLLGAMYTAYDLKAQNTAHQKFLEDEEVRKMVEYQKEEDRRKFLERQQKEEQDQAK
jgi:hypothetical protein